MKDAHVFGRVATTQWNEPHAVLVLLLVDQEPVFNIRQPAGLAADARVPVVDVEVDGRRLLARARVG